MPGQYTAEMRLTRRLVCDREIPPEQNAMNAELGNIHSFCDGVEETPERQRNFPRTLG